MRIASSSYSMCETGRMLEVAEHSSFRGRTPRWNTVPVVRELLERMGIV